MNFISLIFVYFVFLVHLFLGEVPDIVIAVFEGITFVVFFIYLYEVCVIIIIIIIM